MSQIKFAPLGCGRVGTVEREQEQRKLEEKTISYALLFLSSGSLVE